MMGTFKASWSPGTGAAAVRTPTHATTEDWTYTRGMVLRVLRGFPEILPAIRKALAAARRTTPAELRSP